MKEKKKREKKKREKRENKREGTPSIEESAPKSRSNSHIWLWSYCAAICNGVFFGFVKLFI